MMNRLQLAPEFRASSQEEISASQHAEELILAPLEASFPVRIQLACHDNTCHIMTSEFELVDADPGFVAMAV